MKIHVHICKRCGNEWASRNEHPDRCGVCKSPNWYRERIYAQRQPDEGVEKLKEVAKTFKEIINVAEKRAGNNE